MDWTDSDSEVYGWTEWSKNWSCTVHEYMYSTAQNSEHQMRVLNLKG